MTAAGEWNGAAAGQGVPGGGRLFDRVAPQDSAAPLACQRCGFPVSSRPLGCKNPCGNCGTVYPLGDCSD